MFSKTSSKSIKNEYAPSIALRIISIMFVILLIISFGVVVFFIQQKVFTTIEKVSTIINLQTDLGMTTLEYNRFLEVEKMQKEKYSAGLPTFARNPFNLTLSDNEINSTSSVPIAEITN